jgi:hypothetical protein
VTTVSVLLALRHGTRLSWLLLSVESERKEKEEEEMNDFYMWWENLDRRKRRMVLDKIGATNAQKDALVERNWIALSGWVRKKLKKLRNTNVTKDSWQKLMEETS